MENGKDRAHHHMEKVEIKAEVVRKYEEGEEYEDAGKKKKPPTMSGGAWSGCSGGNRLVAAGSGASPRSCQAYKCTADLSEAKTYHRRHRVCEVHAKAPAVVVAGVHQRFCQQCSRFHELSEFDETKRSCRRRLAGHNERRRKNSADQSHLQASSAVKGSSAGTQLKELICGQVDEEGRFKIAIQDNPAYKHFHLS